MSDPPPSITNPCPPPRPLPREPSNESGRGSIDADPLIGFIVGGRYRILERLGRGGMSTVYKVQHVKLGKLLALKLLAGELAREPSIVRRFEQEAFLASRLSHPNTVQVFDYGVSDGLTWLVMELIDGQDLSDILRKEGPLPASRVVKIIAQVCGSLAEAHRQEIVHRDLKPGNIMVTRGRDGDDWAKVCDFGLAKLRQSPELAEVTGSGVLIGTPAYMPPEQIEGGPVDGRSDVYSLGALLYRLLTGEAVFGNGAEIGQILKRHLNEAPEPPQRRTPHLNIPEALGAVVIKALAKQPADRYQTVEELRDAMLAAISPDRGLSTTLPEQLPVVPPENATRNEVAAYERKLRRQRRVAVGVVAVSLLSACYGSFAAFRLLTAPPPFDGAEAEPNNTAPLANELPFGRTVSGHVGKRIDPEHADVDFYRVSVPPTSPRVSMRLTGLPNMGVCAQLFASGEREPRARLCSGRPRLDLQIPVYRLDPGSYLIAVTQDRAPRAASGSPEVVENVSDAYHLTVEPAPADASGEHEPNDSAATADTIEPGRELRGHLAWVHDVDVLCAPPRSGPPVRWVVDHSPSPGAQGSALEVTLLDGDQVESIVRVHEPSAQGRPDAADTIGTWRSAPQTMSERPSCVRLRRVRDPWQSADAPREAPVNPDSWSVRLEITAGS